MYFSRFRSCFLSIIEVGKLRRVIFVILAVAALAPNQIATIVGFVGTIAATVIFSKAKRNKAAAA